MSVDQSCFDVRRVLCRQAEWSWRTSREQGRFISRADEGRTRSKSMVSTRALCPRRVSELIVECPRTKKSVKSG